MTRILVIFSLCCLSLGLAETVSNKGYRVLRIYPNNEEQVTFLKRLGNEYDFWKDPINLKQPVDVRLSPKQFVVVKTKLMKRAIKFEVMNDDVEQQAQPEKADKISTVDLKSSHKRHQMLRIFPKNEEQLTFLKSLQNEYDFSKYPTNLKQSVEVRLSPKQFVVVKTKLMKRAIKFEVINSDVEKPVMKPQVIPKQADKVNTVDVKVSYKGHRVLRIFPKNEEQLTFLKSLQNEYDFWKDPVNLKQPVDVRLSPKQFVVVKTKLMKRAIKYEVMIEDVERAIQQQFQPRKADEGSPELRLDEYHTLAEINTMVADLATNYPDLVELVEIPEPSFEGRTITVVKLSSGGSGKPGFWFDGGIHAREWISPAVVLYMLTQMVTLYGVDDDVTTMVDNFDWYILPVFNVDGYEYTWTDERLWRKTRSTNEGTACIGTDPNRNWDFQWGTVGISHNPCFDTYCGSHAFSEIEVASVVAYAESLPNMQGYLAYHNYGQMYMVPWGYTSEVLPPDFDELMEVCEAAEGAIEAVHGTQYVCDQLINLVGPSSGSSADYMYAVAGIKYSYGVELRDTGTFGFLLPESQIIPTGEESFAGLKEFASQIISRITPQDN